MGKDNAAKSAAASLMGKASANSLTKKQRRARAKNAAEARWASVRAALTAATLAKKTP